MMDLALEKLAAELPGYKWLVWQEKNKACCVLTSPDFKSYVWHAGGKDKEEIQAGMRVSFHARRAHKAMLGAIAIAKDQTASATDGGAQ